MRRWTRVWESRTDELRARRNRRLAMPEIRVLDSEGRWDKNNEDEFLWWPRVLWIDPGDVSGCAVVWFDPQALLVEGAKTSKVVLAYSEWFLHGEENGLNGQIASFMKYRAKLDEEVGLATGCERFTVLKTDSSESYLSPVRIRAGVEFAMSTENRRVGGERAPKQPLLLQSPSDAKGAFTVDRLRDLRMHTPGPDHLDDAKRHCLLHIRRLKAPGVGSDAARRRFTELHGHEEGWWA